MMGNLAMKMDDKEPSTSSSKTSPTSTRPESQSYTVDTVESNRPKQTPSEVDVAVDSTKVDPDTQAQSLMIQESSMAVPPLDIDVAEISVTPEIREQPETAELDLAAMRMAVGGRAKPAVPESVDTSAAQSVIAKAAAANTASSQPTSNLRPDDGNIYNASASDDDSEPDLAAMRAAIKRRTRRHIDASVSSARRRNAEIVASGAKAGKPSSDKAVLVGNHDPDGNEIRAVPEFAIDASHVSSEDVQASVIPPELMAILKNANGMARP